jgi:hypothetical protein
MSFIAFRTAHALLPAICIGGGVLLASCSGNGAPGSGLLDNLVPGSLQSKAGPPPPPTVEYDTSCGTPAQCKSALRTMIEDPKRSWVGQPQPAGAYASGTRLFAYRALRKRLSCRELALAVDEMRAASKSLAGPVAGMTADQVTRTRALSSQVESELAKERAGRCRA